MALSQAQSDLVDRVLRKLDALDSPGSNIVQSQTEIYTLLQEAARRLILTVPLRLLHELVADATDEVNLDTFLYNVQPTSGHTKVVLPNDFLRLVHLELAGWTMGRTHEDMHEDSINEYRKYLRGRTATTGDPRIFRTWCPARFKGVLTVSGFTSPADTLTLTTEQIATLLGITFSAVIGVDEFLAGAAASVTVEGLADLINGAEVYEGTLYAAGSTSPVTGVRASFDDAAGTLTIYCDEELYLQKSSAVLAWDATQAAVITDQREILDCFPASNDATLFAKAGYNNTYSNLVSAFNYIPDTAPESMPTGLVEAMLWQAAALSVVALDPVVGQLCEAEVQKALNARTKRHHTVRHVRRRPMGL